MREPAAAAAGAWGAAVSGINWFKRRQPCPECDKGQRDMALSITRRADGSFLAHCFRCGAVFFSDERKGRAPTSPRPRAVAPGRHATLSAYGHALWRACSPVSGPARAYLEARGCAIPPADGDLRWHPALRHPSGHEGAALVALLTDAATREPRSLHRTWIRPDGTKATDPPRLLLKGHVKAGTVCRLWPDEAVTLGLLVAEGVETALTATWDYAPAWACIDAGNLAGLPVLAGIESLVIAADHDPAGIGAATTCADRWARAGVDVIAVAPRAARADWNDRSAA